MGRGYGGNPTDRQLEVLTYLSDYISAKGQAPKLVEIGAAFGVNRISVHETVNHLVSKGLVDKEPFVARGLRLTLKGRRTVHNARPASEVAFLRRAWDLASQEARVEFLALKQVQAIDPCPVLSCSNQRELVLRPGKPCDSCRAKLKRKARAHRGSGAR